MEKDYYFFLTHPNEVIKLEAREWQLAHRLAKELNMEAREVMDIGFRLRYIYRQGNKS